MEGEIVYVYRFVINNKGETRTKIGHSSTDIINDIVLSLRKEFGYRNEINIEYIRRLH